MTDWYDIEAHART